MGVRSPRKNHTVKFLQELMENDFISKEGKEYSAEEVLQACSEKIDRSMRKSTDLAWRQRSDRIDRSQESERGDRATFTENFGLYQNTSFNPEEFDKEKWILKERLASERFGFTP